MSLQVREPTLNAAVLELERCADPLFGSLTDGVLIHQHGRIAYANRQLCNLLGFEPSELQGGPALALYPDSDYPLALARWQRAAFSARRTAVTNHRLLRRDGRTVSVEVTSLLLSIDDGDALVIEVVRRSQRPFHDAEAPRPDPGTPRRAPGAQDEPGNQRWER